MRDSVTGQRAAARQESLMVVAALSPPDQPRSQEYDPSKTPVLEPWWPPLQHSSSPIFTNIELSLPQANDDTVPSQSTTIPDVEIIERSESVDIDVLLQRLKADKAVVPLGSPNNPENVAFVDVSTHEPAGANIAASHHEQYETADTFDEDSYNECRTEPMNENRYNNESDYAGHTDRADQNVQNEPIADKDSDAGRAYPLRKRSELALHPYTKFSWTRIETIPRGKRNELLKVDASVLYEPLSQTAEHSRGHRRVSGGQHGTDDEGANDRDVSDMPYFSESASVDEAERSNLAHTQATAWRQGRRSDDPVTQRRLIQRKHYHGPKARQSLGSKMDAENAGANYSDVENHDPDADGDWVPPVPKRPRVLAISDGPNFTDSANDSDHSAVEITLPGVDTGSAVMSVPETTNDAAVYVATSSAQPVTRLAQPEPINISSDGAPSSDELDIFSSMIERASSQSMQSADLIARMNATRERRKGATTRRRITARAWGHKVWQRSTYTTSRQTTSRTRRPRPSPRPVAASTGITRSDRVESEGSMRREGNEPSMRRARQSPLIETARIDSDEEVVRARRRPVRANRYENTTDPYSIVVIGRAVPVHENDPEDSDFSSSESSISSIDASLQTDTSREQVVAMRSRPRSGHHFETDQSGHSRRGVTRGSSRRGGSSRDDVPQSAVSFSTASSMERVNITSDRATRVPDRPSNTARTTPNIALDDNRRPASRNLCLPRKNEPNETQLPAIDIFTIPLPKNLELNTIEFGLSINILKGNSRGSTSEIYSVLGQPRLVARDIEESRRILLDVVFEIQSISNSLMQRLARVSDPDTDRLDARVDRIIESIQDAKAHVWQVNDYFEATFVYWKECGARAAASMEAISRLITETTGRINTITESVAREMALHDQASLVYSKYSRRWLVVLQILEVDMQRRLVRHQMTGLEPVRLADTLQTLCTNILEKSMFPRYGVPSTQRKIKELYDLNLTADAWMSYLVLLRGVMRRTENEDGRLERTCTSIYGQLHQHLLSNAASENSMQLQEYVWRLIFAIQPIIEYIERRTREENVNEQSIQSEQIALLKYLFREFHEAYDAKQTDKDEQQANEKAYRVRVYLERLLQLIKTWKWTSTQDTLYAAFEFFEQRDFCNMLGEIDRFPVVLDMTVVDQTTVRCPRGEAFSVFLQCVQVMLTAKTDTLTRLTSSASDNDVELFKAKKDLRIFISRLTPTRPLFEDRAKGRVAKQRAGSLMNYLGLCLLFSGIVPGELGGVASPLFVKNNIRISRLDHTLGTIYLECCEAYVNITGTAARITLFGQIITVLNDTVQQFIGGVQMCSSVQTSVDASLQPESEFFGPVLATAMAPDLQVEQSFRENASLLKRALEIAQKCVKRLRGSAAGIEVYYPTVELLKSAIQCFELSLPMPKSLRGIAAGLLNDYLELWSKMKTTFVVERQDANTASDERQSAVPTLVGAAPVLPRMDSAAFFASQNSQFNSAKFDEVFGEINLDEIDAIEQRILARPPPVHPGLCKFETDVSQACSLDNLELFLV